jgi:hypothetical protein
MQWYVTRRKTMESGNQENRNRKNDPKVLLNFPMLRESGI